MNDRQALIRLEYAKLWIEEQGEKGENNSVPGKFRALIGLNEVIEYMKETEDKPICSYCGRVNQRALESSVCNLEICCDCCDMISDWRGEMIYDRKSCLRAEEDC